MARKVNAATLAHIKASEGLRLKAYPDPGSINGLPATIGYGSTSGVKIGMVITAAQAEARLVNDLSTAESVIERLVKVPLNDNQFGALVSFVFNIGEGQFKSSTLLRLLNAGDYDAVPAQLARWNKNDGKVMAGLTKRRAGEAALWRSAAATDVPAPKPAPNPTVPLPEPAKGKTAPAWVIAAIVLGLAAAGLFFVLT